MRPPPRRWLTDAHAMLLIDCPYCGERPEPEFVYGGQAHIARPPQPADTSVQEWADYLYRRDNARGVHAERWRHTHGCGRFFNALRDTTNDHFLTTYKVGTTPPTLSAPVRR
jgi:sarcosine oxidase subunit delta